MAVFDQRNQKVNYQYNAAGDINFGAVQNRVDLANELEKLHIELVKAIKANVLDEDTATDAEYNLKKAVQQAKNPEPDKKSILEHLNEAKALIDGIASAAGLVSAFATAIELVHRLF